MATIRKRGPGQWQAQIRKRGSSLQSMTFATRAAAARWALSVEFEIAEGKFNYRSEAKLVTLRELLERYVAEITPQKKGAASEAIRIKALMQHPLASQMVATIRGVDIARYRDQRLKSVAPATVRRDLGVLSPIFEIARKEWGLSISNPVRDIKLPANGRPRERRLQRDSTIALDEQSRLFDACEGARNRFLFPIVRLALETAMRRSELLNLQWHFIDLERRIAHLPDTKNGDARTVPLSSVAVETLRSLRRSGKNDVVFGELTAEALKRSFIRATRRAGLDDFHFHDLRHEATTRYFELGLNMMEVATITGHKDLRMLRRYTHLKAEDLAIKLG